MLHFLHLCNGKIIGYSNIDNCFGKFYIIYSRINKLQTRIQKFFTDNIQNIFSSMLSSS